jgi:hypothetical protein
MWVRAVAVALIVGCVSGAAMAAGYTEVWNPPEASGHAVKPAKKRSGEVKGKAGGRLKEGAKPGMKPGSKAGSKAGSKHAAGGQHKAPKVASAAARGGRLPAHAGVKKVSAKGGDKPSGARSIKPKAALVAQASKPRAQRLRAQGAEGKVIRANVDASHPVRPHAVKLASKPAVSHPNALAASANPGAAQASVSANPATASSGSLPPIIR